MNKSVILSALLLGVPFLHSAAQNLNPEIVVTNEYETKMADAPKQGVPLVVPDTLKTFNLNFDYSVFDNPYEGSYEFSPYVVSLKPELSANELRRLWLRAGAGYTLHPVLKAAWTPLRRDAVNMTVFQDFHGYAGNYRSVLPDMSVSKERVFGGYDLSETAGVEALVYTGSVDLKAAVRYDGIYAGEPSMSDSYGNVGASLRVRSNGGDTSPFTYDFGFSIDGASDRTPDKGTMRENRFSLSGTIEPSFAGLGFRTLADIALDCASYKGGPDCESVIVGLTPKAVFRLGPVGISAGVKLAYAGGIDNAGVQFQTPGQVAYPDVHACVGLVGDALNIHADITGGVRAVTYNELKGKNHHFRFDSPVRGALLDNAVERANFTFGLRGRVSDWLQYDASTGYGFYANAPMEFLTLSTVDNTVGTGFCFEDYGMFHADLGAFVKTSEVLFDAVLKYRGAKLYNDCAAAIQSAPFSGNFRFMYNWSSRVMAGLSCDACSARKARVAVWDGTSNSLCETKISGWIDLGLLCEYKLSEVWSVWLQAGNLLNSNIRRNPIYVEDGMSCTVGISLDL